MNRMEEYQQMLDLLEPVPNSDPVARAVNRQKKQRRFVRPLATAAVFFLVFVSVINVSPTVLAACREIPVLKELAEMLTFNPSLRLAVENDYVQMVEQQQTKDDVTVRIEYLIVDQKQVNIFYRLSSERYTALDATPELLDEKGEHLPATIISGGIGVDEEAIRKITVDFVEETVPDTVRLNLKIRDYGSRYAEETVPTQIDDLPKHEEPEYLMEFTFLLQFDPLFTAQGRTVQLDQTVELDGQSITITDMEIYPTHIRLNVQEAETNTAWLTSLRFYLELEDGLRVETISNGITAIGNPDTPSMVSYRAESSYFYDAECIRIYITSADFLAKERETVRINFETLETDELPQGVKLHSAEKKTSGWEVTFLKEASELNHVQILSSTYYGIDGTEYHCGSWGSGTRYYDEQTQQEVPAWDYETYYLEGFHETEGVFTVNYTHFWIPEAPLVVELTAK